jgi:hypothetical protein
VTVTSTQELVATYSTVCELQADGSHEFVQQVEVKAPDGTPTSADFTLEELEPVTYPVP